MKFFVFFLSIFFSTTLVCEGKFGYVSYTSFNIGDDIQAIAAKQFLPEDAIGIDREFVGVFEHSTPLPTVINGWFMHTKDFLWPHFAIKPPQVSWPPSSSLDPLLISLHIAEGFIPYAFSEEAISYLQAHGPIGARDLNTLKELQSRNIPSCFSGCLTLTLENTHQEREDVIYAVDLDEGCYEYLKKNSSTRIERVTHIISRKLAYDPEKRLTYANHLLEKYKKAKAVVTGRLHAAMPCLAFETPLLLINDKKNPRFSGLRELTHQCTRNEFLKGKFDFDFDHPPQNPLHYLVLRDNLIEILNQWVKDKSN